MVKKWVALIALIFSAWNSIACCQDGDLSWLTPLERQWLEKHPLIRVAPTPYYPPFEYWELDPGTNIPKFRGVVRSYLDHFSATLGIEFEVVKTDTWQENLQLLQKREIDAVSLLVPWSDRNYVAVSDTYIEYPAVIVVRKDNMADLTLRDLVGKLVAVPDDYTGENFLRENHPQINIREVAGPAEGVRMVSSGEVDAFFGGASVVAFTAEREGLSNLRIAGVSDFTYANGFGVRSDWATLAKIISKTINRMSRAQHRDFHSQWVTTDFFQRQWYQSREFVWTAGSLAFFFLVGTGLVLVWNRKQAKFIAELERAKMKAEVANIQLDKARREAELANETKSAFVANISHEIRTPMNGILGMCELLRTSQLSSKQHEHLNLATKSAKSLLGLINDILDFSKIEAGKLELEYRPFSLTRLLEEICGLMRVQAEEKGLRLTLEMSADVQNVYEGDGLRVRQILLNLLSNAIKFTRTGSVSLKACVADQMQARTVDCDDGMPDKFDDTSHLICFEVTDTGDGIPADKIDKLFEPFEQEDSSTTRKHGGTGLGLSICKKLAELMGGSIVASSTVGKGSTFVFEARLRPDFHSLAELTESTASQTIEPRRILLAEDGLVNQKVAIGLLEKRGHVVDLAENGLEALAALKSTMYDVVLMDIQMPEMDGLTAVREIRKNEAGTGKRQLVIALTAHAMAGDQERFIEAGMDDHLSKPFRPDDLYAAVENVSSDSATPTDDKSSQPAILDRQIALETTGGDQELAKVLLETCLEESPNIIQAAYDAINENNFEVARRSGHSLKSSFAAVGAMSASAISKELEFIEKDDPDSFRNQLQQIESAFNLLSEQARQSV